jgi:hypothetical protein
MGHMGPQYRWACLDILNNIHHIQILEIQLCISGYEYSTNKSRYEMLGFGYDLTI